MRAPTALIAMSFLALAFAGCTTDESTSVDSGNPEDLTDGLGAIAGLLVDDRFRPIVAGRILVQETAQSVETNENGEFVILNIAPGKYTLRVTAEGHEAIPKTVEVVAGAFVEISIVAQRVVSLAGEVVTREYAIFIPCNAYATVGCPPDMSGDTYRPGISGTFEEYLPELTYSVWEMKLNNPYIFCLEVRESSGTGASLDRHFANWCEGQDSTYLRGILQANETYDETVSNDPWDPTADTDAILFTFGNNEATCWEKPPENNRYRCAGVGFAIKAQIMVSFFLSEPKMEIEDYCLICQ